MCHISTVKRNSDTVEGLSLTKRVYAILWENKCSDLAEGSLEVKFPTIWTDEKQTWEESERREE